MGQQDDPRRLIVCQKNWETSLKDLPLALFHLTLLSTHVRGKSRLLASETGIKGYPTAELCGKGELHSARARRMRSACSRIEFVRMTGEVREHYGFLLVGYVVMPEHIHLLISEPARGTPSTVMQVLKQRVSRRLRCKRRRNVTSAQFHFRFGSEQNTPRSFWQRQFYDFNV